MRALEVCRIDGAEVLRNRGADSPRVDEIRGLWSWIENRLGIAAAVAASIGADASAVRRAAEEAWDVRKL